MAVEVRIPTILRPYTGDQKAVTAEGATLSAVIDDLEANQWWVQWWAQPASVRQRLCQRRGCPLHRRPRRRGQRRRPGGRAARGRGRVS